MHPVAIVAVLVAGMLGFRVLGLLLMVRYSDHIDRWMDCHIAREKRRCS